MTVDSTGTLAVEDRRTRIGDHHRSRIGDHRRIRTDDRPRTTTGRRRPKASHGRRGSSEVIGFILVFAVVFAGIGAVYTAGFDTLTEVRDREQVASAERAFLALSGPVDDVRARGVDRAGVLSPGTGRLQVDAGPTVTVHANGSTRLIETGALTYRTDGPQVTHENGGVFRADAGGSVVLREPAVVCRPDAAVVSVATLRTNGTGIDADGPVEVVFEPTSTAVWRADRVTVDVAPSPVGDAWGRHLGRSGWNETGTATYGCDADRTVVRRTTVHVRFVA